MARKQNPKQIVARWLVAHHAAMLRLAGSFADEVHGPEDIVSRARVVVLGRHAEVADVKSPLRWLLAITRSVGLQVVRNRDRRAELRRAGSLEGSGLFQPPDEDVAREWGMAHQFPDQRRDQVLEIARGLSGALRELVNRTLIDGWNDEEIANHHRITRSAVRRRRKRAVEAILAKLPPPLPGMMPQSSPGMRLFAGDETRGGNSTKDAWMSPGRESIRLCRARQPLRQGGFSGRARQWRPSLSKPTMSRIGDLAASHW